MKVTGKYDPFILMEIMYEDSFLCFLIFGSIRKNDSKENYFWTTKKLRLIFKYCFLQICFEKEIYLTTS